MEQWRKILIAVAFSIVATLLAMAMMVMLTGEHIPWPFWVFTVICPACISGPISAVLVRQSEANRRLNEQLMLTQAELRLQVDRDHLTGVLNRAAFYRHAEAYDRNDPACVLLADIDHFKTINDAHGHAAGDHALRMVAKTFTAALGTDDLLGRVGGEEFAILLAGMPLPLAITIAERARDAIAALAVKTANGTPIALSISIGVAPFAAGMSLDAALAQADAAMYGAKRNGRNRVQVAG
ncbi:GGDEF domain-containing protein [Blastomonas sp. AAP53]|uniref:GGDEF domain-containing protein n=1 Tax=Blastomonas sp. AAP53 TaxID=1248760 RepID=UPI00036E9E11|nr:GGDEF domain-containing protein [Blastomonas sp. AAP53]